MLKISNNVKNVDLKRYAFGVFINYGEGNGAEFSAYPWHFFFPKLTF